MGIKTNGKLGILSIHKSIFHLVHPHRYRNDTLVLTNTVTIQTSIAGMFSKIKRKRSWSHNNEMIHTTAAICNQDHIKPASILTILLLPLMQFVIT